MKIDQRHLLLLLALITMLVYVIAQAAAHAAEPLRLSPAGGAGFPDRSFVLTLPEDRSLSPEDLRLTENGAPVESVRVTPGDEAGADTFGVVLAIDASESMAGQASRDAVAAARAFAAQRQPNQALGVVFFSRTATVALEPTTDGDRIDSVLAAPPGLTPGTRIYDATAAGVELLRDAGISSGSVVVLSDGVDGHSETSPEQLAEAIRGADARVFTVGMRSDGYDATSLEQIALLGGGTYAEASSSGDLASIFDSLGKQLGDQYLLEYRSQSPLGARVEVLASVDGIDGTAAAVYRAPSFRGSATSRRHQETMLDSKWAPVALALLLGAIIGFVTFVFVRPGRGSVRSRIAGFISSPARDGDEDAPKRPRPVAVTSAANSFRRLRWWSAFEEEVELARLDFSAARIAAWTVGGSLALAYVFGVLADRLLLGIASLGLPIAVRAFIRFRVGRERRAFRDQLAENLQVLASAMRAGHSFLGALAVMADDAGEPARREFGRVLQDEQIGVPVQTALATVARRMKNPDVEYVGLVAQLQIETGGNTAEVLDRVTETIRERNALYRLVRTLTAQGRMGGWVVSLMPVGLVLALNVLNPTYLDPLFSSSGGRIMLAIGVTCLVTGMLIIRRVVDIKV